jgi:hypothetical protein
VQVLKLGDALPDMELLLPRGGAAAFALDMQEPNGQPTALTGTVELVVDGGMVGQLLAFPGVATTVWVLNGEDTLPNGMAVTALTPGAEAVTRVLFELDAADTFTMAYGPHRGAIRYTPIGVGTVLLCKGLVVLQ